MAAVRDGILAALRAGLAPAALEVEDESHKHAGHGGWRPGGETHFRVRVVAEAFNGRNRLERHRLVNGLLADAFNGGVHALAIEARGTDDAPAAPGTGPR